MEKRFYTCTCCFLALYFLPPPNINAQDLCGPIDACANLKVEIVRDPHDNTSSGSSCPGSTLCGGGNSFQQTYYKVYLRYSGAVQGSPNAFNLQYNRLNVSVRLENLTSGSRKFSHINVARTESCFSSSSSWDPTKVAFLINEAAQTVELDFMNDNQSPSTACGTGDDLVHFVKGAPSTRNDACQNCYYAELFTVVVNAFAGESIRLGLANETEYVPFDDQQDVCAPLGVVNTGTHNGTSTVQITTPITYTNTDNEDLILEVLDDVSGSNNGRDFEIRLRNANTSKMRKVKYLEFAVKVTSSEDIFLSTTGTHTARAIITDGNDKYLHYLIEFGTEITINALSSYTIGLVHIEPPFPINQAWAVTVAMEAEEGSRIQTESYCTRVHVSTQSQAYTSVGLTWCNMAQTFQIQPKGIFDPCGSGPVIVQAGLEFPSSGQLNIERLVFELEFELTGSLAITGVNFDDWDDPNWTCPTPVSISCLANPSTGNCYDIIGNNKIRFCLSVPGSNAVAIYDDSYINIEFNNNPGCVQNVIIRELELALNGQTSCIPPINNTLSGGVSLCPPMVKGQIETEIGDGVEAVDMNIELESSSSSNCTVGSNCQPISCSASYDTHTDINGYFGKCVCADCNCYTVTPYKNDNPLNGITTFDLVLISKHILGIESLGSPYKMIAADANKSNSITTFDIVEIRKLLLGIYDTFPSNTSWRFVDAAYDFPNPSNPFSEDFPEKIENYNSTGSSTANFTGIKIGDVNNTVAAHSRPLQRPLASFSITAPALAPGQIVTIPIVYQGPEPLEAFQFGIKYDTSVLRLISPSMGNVPYFDASCLNTTLPGALKAVWLPFDPEYRIAEGDILFNLTFQVKGPANTPLLTFDDSVLYNAVWRSDDTECAVTASNAALRRDALQIYAPLNASIHPNPGSTTASLEVNALEKGKARVLLFDAYGRRLLLRDVNLTSGRQTVELPETGALSPGVYNWQLVTGSIKTGGSWVKQ